MAKVEVDETDLRAMGNLAQTFQQMMANPESRKLVLKARKTADPTAVIPELDAAEPIRGEIDEIRKMLADERAERAKEREKEEADRKVRDFQAEWDKKKAKLRSAQGYTDEALEKIETLAQERGIADLDAAAALFDRLNPAPTIAQPGGGSWEFFDPQQGEQDDYIKRLFEAGPDLGDSVLNSQISRTLAEARGQARR